MRRVLRLPAAAVAAAGALALLAAGCRFIVDQWEYIGAHRTDPAGVLVVIAAGYLVVAAARCAIAAAAETLACLVEWRSPGAGRGLRAFSRRAAPLLVRCALAGLAGATASCSAGVDAPAHTVAVSPGWEHASPSRLPSTDTGTDSHAHGSHAHGRDHRSGRARQPGSVVVRRGDSLWSIARRALPRGATTADVATAWPRWYRANRDVIGDDPDVLRPGVRLVPPRSGHGAEHDR